MKHDLKHQRKFELLFISVLKSFYFALSTDFCLSNSCPNKFMFISRNVGSYNYFQKQPPEMFMQKSVLRNFTSFEKKHLCQSFFFSKVAGLWPANFAANFVKYLRIPFLQNTSGRLLLYFEAIHLIKSSFQYIYERFKFLTT